MEIVLSEHQGNVAKAVSRRKRPRRHVAFINTCMAEVIQNGNFAKFSQSILSLSLFRRSVQAVFKKWELRKREGDGQTTFDQTLTGLHVPSIRYTGCTQLADLHYYYFFFFIF